MDCLHWYVLALLSEINLLHQLSHFLKYQLQIERVLMLQTILNLIYAHLIEH